MLNGEELLKLSMPSIRIVNYTKKMYHELLEKGEYCTFYLNVQGCYIDIEIHPSIDQLYFYIDFSKHLVAEFTEEIRIFLSEFVLCLAEILMERNYLRLLYHTGQYAVRFHPYFISDFELYYVHFSDEFTKKIESFVLEIKRELIKRKKNQAHSRVIGKPICRIFGEDSKTFVQLLLKHGLIHLSDNSNAYVQFTLSDRFFDQTFNSLTYFTQKVKSLGFNITP